MIARAKALVSGAVPDFGDVVRNAGGAHAMAGLDSVVHQATAAGLSAVFYGDDTWLRLFPDHFLRSDGTTSFFVNDYTEVCIILLFFNNTPQNRATLTSFKSPTFTRHVFFLKECFYCYRLPSTC